MNKTVPNFFVVGAPKAGTSSLYQYLGRHPQVYVPEVKEPHHFSCPEVTDTYYKVEFVADRAAYLALFSGVGDELWAGDFSPSYLYSPHAARRIADFNPDARIIILLRDPVDRAISHYLMDVRLGLQKRPMLDCIGPGDKNRRCRKEYLDVGQYSAQVQRYFDLFPREQVLVMRYDDLVADAAGFLHRIQTFLGLAPSSEVGAAERHNPFRLPRSAVLGSLYNSPLKRRLRGLVPDAWKARARKLIFSSAKPDMARERQELVQYFEKDLAALESITGWDLTNWKRANG